MVGDDEDEDRHLDDGEGIQGGGHDRLFVSYIVQWRSTRRRYDIIKETCLFMAHKSFVFLLSQQLNVK